MAIRKALTALVSPETLLPEGEYGGWPQDVPPPQAFLQPGSEEEVARILARASQEGWRVLPSGAGSWLRGGGTPEVDLVLSTRRLTGMAIYEPADLTFTAGSGILMADLAETTGANGQWLPLDPPGAGKGTLGGVVSTGVAGPLRHAYGSPRDHILGLTLVAGDGRILRWGGRVVKNVAGFDITRLTLGSFGTLGVITSVSARLFPLPEEDRTLLITGSSAETLLPLARRLFLSNLPVAALELLDPLDGVLAGKKGGAGLALRLMGTKLHVKEMASRARAALGEGFGSGGEVSTLDGKESAGFFHALGDWEEGAGLVVRLSLLPSKAEALLVHARALAEEADFPCGVRLSLQVGAGLLRMVVGAMPTDEKTLAGIGEVLLATRRGLEEEGGSLVLSEGPAALLRRVGSRGMPGPEGKLMAGLKKAFDPQGVLAPGRLSG